VASTELRRTQMGAALRDVLLAAKIALCCITVTAHLSLGVALGLTRKQLVICSRTWIIRKWFRHTWWRKSAYV
jgi:hypothetical protein